MEVKSIRPAATLRDTLFLMQRQECAVTTLMRGGLRLTLVPGKWFSLSRQYVPVGHNEIVTVCNTARSMGLMINPMDAKPGKQKNTVAWALEEKPLE